MTKKARKNYYVISKKYKGEHKDKNLYILHTKRDAQAMLGHILKTSKATYGKAGSIFENFFMSLDRNSVTVMEKDRTAIYKIKKLRNR